eukprot:9501884-Pyramimonas_sp.AAC.1
MARSCFWFRYTLIAVLAGLPAAVDHRQPHLLAFQWATSTAIQLDEAGAPSCCRSGYGLLMLEAATARLVNDLPRIPRTIACAELFSGQAGITRDIINYLDLAAYAADKLYQPWMDATTMVGTLYCLYLAACIVPTGLLWMSPECSTWIDMCRHHTRRSRDDPWGDDTRTDVEDANYSATLVSPGGQQ